MQINTIKSNEYVKIECRYAADAKLAVQLKALPISLPDELKEAHAGRQRDYLLGRFCALTALQHWGCFLDHLPSQANRAPAWPEGFTGSITHTTGYAAAAVVPTFAAKSIGIDAEALRRRYTPRMIQHICTSREQQLRTPPELSPHLLAPLVFSAKESLFKCLHPLARVFFGFQAAEITEVTDKTFKIKLLTTLPAITASEFAGHYLYDQDLLHTQVLYR